MNKHLFKHFKRYIIPPIILLSFLSLVSSGTSIFFAVYSKDAIDTAIAGDMKAFRFFAVVLISIIALQLIVSAVNRYLTVLFSNKLYAKVSLDLYDILLDTRYDALSQYHSEDITNYFKTDLKIVSDRMIGILPTIIFNVGRFLGAFIVLFLFDYQFALFLVALGVVLLLAARLLQNPLKKLNVALLESVFEREAHINETFNHVDLAKTFNAPIKKSKMKEKVTTAYKKSLKKERLYVLSQFGITLFFGFGYLFALIFGAWRISTGLLSEGELVSIMQLVQNIQNPFSRMSTVMGQIIDLRSSLDRLTPIIHLRKEEKHIHLDGFDTIKISNLSFAYDDESPVLENINLEIKPGDIIYINAASGRGKTTLFRVLLGLYQADGIKVYKGYDEFNYYEVNNSLLAYVPQNSFLFQGSILDNLTLGTNYSIDQVIEACKLACIYDDIIKMENGLNTMLGEDGKGLSLGQSQRIAIARAILKDAPIFILDEISASFDKETEDKVFKNIESLNKTLLISSHNLIPINHNKEIILTGTDQNTNHNVKLEKESLNLEKGS